MSEDHIKGTISLKPTQLSLTLPDGKQQIIPLLAEVVHIGRELEYSDIPLPSELKSISRRHCEIRRKDGVYVLTDLNSSNGVFVNGQKVDTIELKDGDEIRIGKAENKQEVVIRIQLGTEFTRSFTTAEQMTLSHFVGLIDTTPVNDPYLILRFPKGQIKYFSIREDIVSVGRSTSVTISLPYRFVSGRHFELRQLGNDFNIVDLQSTNGTLLNNEALPPHKTTPLHTNAIIRIGDEASGNSVGFTFINPHEKEAPQDGFMMASPKISVERSKPTTIGRTPEADMRLDAPDVSRRHASLQMIGGQFVLEDLDSANGTFVNKKRIKSTILQNGDLIEIGKFLLVFADGQITSYKSNGMRLDVSALEKDVQVKGGKRRILDNISMSILPREFVAIVGGSGAGKSTLLNALVGLRPGVGQVKLNGHDFYRDYEHFRAQLGYVPQNDILHMTLTVENALDYAARLRLPASITAEERKRRIAAVLDTVSMNTETIRKTRIGDLSGGQRKRVSIAAELLADPKMIYLDEATSGLDPGLEKKMMHTLRRMADEGRTVVLITHATDNIVQADHVAFLSQGKLIFFGPSAEALEFFEVADFADIYEKIEHSGEEWRNIFEKEKPAGYEKYVQQRQVSSRSVPEPVLAKMPFGPLDLLRQFFVLVQRSLSVLLSDPVTLVLMLLLLPLTGTLQLIIGSKDVLTGNLSILADPIAAAKTLLENYAPYAKTNTFVFVMGLEAVLTGLFVPSNDLVKERSIYLRERMVNLKVLPYLMSKAFIYSIFVVVQVFLYMVILSFGVKFPNQGLYLPGALEIFITLFLTMMAGISFGFIISAVSRSTEMAIYLLTMMLFFQFFFSGAVFDLRGNTFEPLSYLSTTRWSLTALGVSIDMPRLVESTILCSDVPSNPLDPNSAPKTVCENYKDASKDLLINYDQNLLVRSWLVLTGMSLLFLTTTGILLQRTTSD